MKPALFVRLMLRESRGDRGRLLFFATCIAIGVMAVVGVGSLVEATEAGLRARSRELLGGDLAVEARRPLPDVRAHLPARYREGLAQVDLWILPTMVQNGAGRSRLAEIKAIDARRGAFPLAGKLELQPARPLSELLDDRSVVLAPELLRDLALSPGDRLRIGGRAFVVRGSVAQEPERLGFSFAFGPRVLMTKRALDTTGLLGFGSRVRYRSVFAFARRAPNGALTEIKHTLLASLPGAGSFIRIEGYDDAQPQIRKTLTRVQRYLGLVALLSLLLGSIGVAQIVGTWIAQSTEQTAVMRCLGLRPREVMLLYLAHVVLLALVGSAAGAAVGAALPHAAASAYPMLLPPEALVGFPLRACAQGLALGVLTALLFSVPPLTAIWKVSPALVLRSEAAPLPVPRSVRTSALALAGTGVLGAALIQSHDLSLAFTFTAAVIALSALLHFAATALQRGVGALPRRRLPALLWQGAAALKRPSAGTTASIVALGLGTLVVLAIALVERALDAEVESVLPENAPSVFLTDVQPDQWADVESLSRHFGARHVQSVPVVMARLSAVDGTEVSKLVAERQDDESRARWVLTREQRITWFDALPKTNVLIEGKLWQRDDVAELSLEQDFARDLGVGVGSRLRLDVQGVPMNFTVTSLRDVEWRSFDVNFFIVAEPGYLEQAPQFRIGAMRVAPEAEQPIQDALTRRYPNVTVILVRRLIERVAGILDQVAFALRLLGGFAVLTGLIILISAVASTQLRRAREAALLKTLGVTRAHIAALFAVEYALRGAVAGSLGALFAYGLAYGFTSQVLELSRPPSPLLCLAAIVITSALSVGGGLLASARALWVRPLFVLRDRL